MQTKPNPAQPTPPAIEAVRHAGERGTAAPTATSSATVGGSATAGEAPLAAREIPAVQKVPAPPAPEVSRPETDARMVVGPNIKMRGVEIADCDTLIVEGSIEATMDARQIEIAQTGSYTGKASVDNAEIHGLFTGELTVRRKLVIHATGKVGGTLRYGKMVVEEGGEIAGDVKSLAAGNGQGNAVKPFPSDARPAADGSSARH